MKSFSVESTGLMNGIDSLSRRNEELGIQIKKMQDFVRKELTEMNMHGKGWCCEEYL